MSGKAKARTQTLAWTFVRVAKRPRTWRDIPVWFISLFPGKRPFEQRVPWFTFGGNRWLDQYIRREHRVFEYGSGASTLYFADHAAEVISVEHEASWADAVGRQLDNDKVQHVTILLKPPQKGDNPEFGSFEQKYQRYNFADYAKAIDAYPDKSFDLIVVDGRSRNACIRHALPKVKPGGFLLFDNSHRRQYAPSWELLKSYEHQTFFGLCPAALFLSQTTVWRIDK